MRESGGLRRGVSPMGSECPSCGSSASLSRGHHRSIWSVDRDPPVDHLSKAVSRNAETLTDANVRDLPLANEGIDRGPAHGELLSGFCGPKEILICHLRILPPAAHTRGFTARCSQGQPRHLAVNWIYLSGCDVLEGFETANQQMPLRATPEPPAAGL